MYYPAGIVDPGFVLSIDLIQPWENQRPTQKSRFSFLDRIKWEKRSIFLYKLRVEIRKKAKNRIQVGKEKRADYF
jgi:hypothetical protein